MAPRGLRFRAIAIMADILSVIPNEAKHVHAILLQLLRDTDLSCVKFSLNVLIPLILHRVIKIEGNLHKIAECLVSPDPDVAHTCRVFFKKYFLTARKTLPKTIFQIFCGLSGEERREIMSVLLKEFCSSENEALVSLFLASLRESIDIDKLFILSLLKPSNKSLVDLRNLLSSEVKEKIRSSRKEGGDTRSSKKEGVEMPLQRFLVTNAEALGFLERFLSNANKGVLKDEAMKMMTQVATIVKHQKEQKKKFSKSKLVSRDGDDVFSVENLDKLKMRISFFDDFVDGDTELENLTLDPQKEKDKGAKSVPPSNTLKRKLSVGPERTESTKSGKKPRLAKKGPARKGKK
eukprot:TRINITY_DN479_c0_g1_i14.p2 TRINITY_DN479_c0_g1~~TRINITY_DN479_c0_g1_i14.p2  ORF type:complete len:349 (-),score=65.95 TRINITY_DN479_c0_g1_i14:35-1081(-)